MIWCSKVRRAFQLIAARRFALSLFDPANKTPGACILVPDGIDIADVHFWTVHEYEARGIL